MFSLDIFDSCSNFWNCSLGLLIHNLPVFVLAIILWASWKREWIAGIMFIFAGLLYIGIMINNMIKYNLEGYMISYSFIIAGPAIIIGVLFFLNWKRRRK